ncbi:MAG: hypothetical protein WC130_11170 [Kiritimatiellia bacterium]|jgi:hypothetical protein
MNTNKHQSIGKAVGVNAEIKGEGEMGGFILGSLCRRIGRRCSSQRSDHALIDELPDPAGDTPDKEVGLFCPHCNRIYRQRDIAHLKALNAIRTGGNSRLLSRLERWTEGLTTATTILVLVWLLSLLLMGVLPESIGKRLFLISMTACVLSVFASLILLFTRKFLECDKN